MHLSKGLWEPVIRQFFGVRPTRRRLPLTEGIDSGDLHKSPVAPGLALQRNR